MNQNKQNIYQIISKTHISKHKKEINYIIDYCDRKNIGNDIRDVFISILLIETFYRPSLFRLCEYLIVTFKGIIAIIFKSKIKNYTVGCFQLGLGCILKYNNYDIYEHLRSIDMLTIDMFIIILKSFYYKNNIEAALWRIEKYYNELYKIDMGLAVRRVGEKYNGDYEYGLLTEKVYNEIISIIALEPMF